MPTLQITRQGFAPEHAGTAHDYVLSIKLFPIECDDRLELQRSQSVHRRKVAALAVPGMPGLAMDGDLADELEDVLPKRLIAEKLRPQIARGFRVGYFFACAYSHWYRGQGPLAIKLLQGDILQAGHPVLDVSEKLVELDRHEFQSVGPLWAAHFICMAENRLDLLRPERLADYLSLSEMVREALMAKARTHKGTPVLSPTADVWRPPAWLQLPPQRWLKPPL